MATQNVCSHNKYGFCKHRDMCRNLHVKEICENSSCEISMCMLRHPKMCKYYRNFGRCKFDPCAFKHIDNKNTIENLMKENENILSKIDSIDLALSALCEKEREIQINLDKVEKFEEKVNSFEEVLESKENLIEELTKRVDAMETKLIEKIDIIDNLLDIMRKYENFSENSKILERKVYILEKREEGIFCCKFCEKEFSEYRKFQIHEIHTHTFKCEVCEHEAENKEMLDIHLSTCELYECNTCKYSHKRLSEMKRHCTTEHKERTLISHLKMDRETFLEVTCKGYWSDNI